MKETIKKIYTFLKKDSWTSLLVNLILALIFIKFIFFPLLTLVTGSPLPLVIVESCSMYHHEYGFERILDENAVYQRDFDITLEDTINWPFQNGLKKGDVIFIVGAKNIEKGDIIIFNPEDSMAPYPIIHRIVTKDPLGTKGDNFQTNSKQLTKNNNANQIDETDIEEDQVIGKALFRVPLAGWVKLIFFEPLREPSSRGFCG